MMGVMRGLMEGGAYKRRKRKKRKTEIKEKKERKRSPQGKRDGDGKISLWLNLSRDF